MSLTIQQKTILNVDSYDFETFVHEIYPNCQYEFQADMECGNDTQHSFDGIDGTNGVLGWKWDEPKIEQFKRGEWIGYFTRVILEDLCRNGHIPAGDYLISISY